MDKKSKIFFLVFSLLIAVSVAVTFWRIMIKRDYIISAEQDCDPTKETCFVRTCDPAEDEECSKDPKERTSYYKIIKKNAKNIPPCDPRANGKEKCPTELSCEEGEAECEYVFCNEENVPENEECNDPEKYREENPAEEENGESEENKEDELGADKNTDKTGADEEEAGE